MLLISKNERRYCCKESNFLVTIQLLIFSLQCHLITLWFSRLSKIFPTFVPFEISLPWKQEALYRKTSETSLILKTPEVFAEVIMKIRSNIVWNAMPCSLVDSYSRFGGICCLYSHTVEVAIYRLHGVTYHTTVTLN